LPLGRKTKEFALLWSIAAVVALGMLIGFRFRAPALIAVTAATIITSAVISGFGGLPERQLVVPALRLMIILQCAYLVGLFLAVVWRRIAANAQGSPEHRRSP
jgi:hypothetical protein